MTSSPPSRLPLAWVALSTLWLSACSTLAPASPTVDASTGSAPASALAAPGTAAPRPPSPPSSKSNAPAFDAVIKGATRVEGLLPLWRRDDKVWIELSPLALEQSFYLSPAFNTGIGEAGIFAGLMSSRFNAVGRPHWVQFRQHQQQVQLLALNAAYTAADHSTQAASVRTAFSPSLLASVAVASAPRQGSGAILIEANALLLGDLLGTAARLQQTYKQGYGLDARHTRLSQASSVGDELLFDVQQHFAVSSIVPAGPSSGSGSGASFPSSVPDPRSFFVTVRYRLSALPGTPMPARPADPRVGYFTTTVADFSDVFSRTPRKHYINRWRLDRPLVYDIDASIPEDYRGAVAEGILEWNKAFAAIGLPDIIQVRMPSPQAGGSAAQVASLGAAPLAGDASPPPQPVSSASQEGDSKAPAQPVARASVRWMTNSKPQFGAIGPSHVDPRSGEILRADIGLESLSSRAIRTFRSEMLNSARDKDHQQDHQEAHCEHGALAADQLDYALQHMLLDSKLAPDSLEVQAFVLAYLKDTTMHEVGHTLGLRHNFRASRWRTAAQLQDAELTRKEGISASVMDYNPVNLSLPGQRPTTAFQTTLGPYDFWAIEYGYKDLSASPDAAAELRRIAQRSQTPPWTRALDYGNDEDLRLALDGSTILFDLGQDPLAFVQQRLSFAKTLLQQAGSTRIRPDDEAAAMRRRVNLAIREVMRGAGILLRQVGAVETRRDAPYNGRDALDPVPASTQRAALRILGEQILSPQVLSLPPSLLRRLAPDFLERDEASDAARTEFSAADQVLDLQRAVLRELMDEQLATRVLDNQDRSRDRREPALTVGELHQRIRRAVWGPALRAPQGAQAAWQRNLQREHVNRLATLLVRNGSARADVRALTRQQVRELHTELKARSWGGKGDVNEAHRRDCVDTLAAALAAPLLRSGV